MGRGFTRFKQVVFILCCLTGIPGIPSHAVEQEAPTPGSIRALLNKATVASGQGHYLEAHDEFQSVLIQAQQAGDFKSVIEANNGLGFASFNLDRLSEAEAAYENSLSLLSAFPDPDAQVVALTGLGKALEKSGQIQGAAKAYEDAIALLGETHPDVKANIFSMLGGVYEKSGALPQSLAAYEKELALWEALHQIEFQETTLYLMGKILDKMGETRKALDTYLRALSLVRETSLKDIEGSLLNLIGDRYHTLGEPDNALIYFNRAAAFFEAAGRQSEQAGSLIFLGVLYDDTYQTQQALSAYESALKLARASGDSRSEGEALAGMGSVYIRIGQPRRALEVLRTARDLYRKIGNPSSEALVWQSLGGAYRNLGQGKNSLDALQRSLALKRQIGERATESNTLISIGSVYRFMGQPQRAKPFDDQALQVAKSTGDQLQVAAALNNLANSAEDQGRYDEASTLYHQAIRLYRAGENARGEGLALNSLGSLYNERGDYESAKNALDQSIALLKKMEVPHGILSALDNLGKAYAGLGSPTQALNAYAQALQVAETSDDPPGLATVLGDIGVFYNEISQPRKALTYLKQSLKINRTIDNPREVATAMANIAFSLADIGQVDEATSNVRAALQINRKIGDRQNVHANLNFLGWSYLERGDYKGAIGYFQSALSISRSLGNRPGEATALNNLGSAYGSLRQSKSSEGYYRKALTLAEAAGDQDTQASVLGNWAMLEEDRGRRTAAVERMKGVLQLLEAKRESLGASTNEKTFFFESKQGYYASYIHWLLSLNRPQEAFEWAEKTKARTLLDLMQGGRLDLQKRMTAEERAKNTSLKDKLQAADRARITEAMKPKPDPARLAALKGRLLQAERVLQAFTDLLYARHPEIAQAHSARTVKWSEMAGFLPPDTALLDFFDLKSIRSNKKITVNQTVLFCVTVQHGRAVLTPVRIPLSREILTQKVEAFRKACSQPGKNFRTQSRELYNLLLAPVARQIAGKKRLLICPDGVLWGLPFQALASRHGAADRYLLEQFEIDYANSATAARWTLAPRRPRKAAALSALMAFANPEFGGRERFTGSEAAPSPAPSDRRQLHADSRQLIADARQLIADARGKVMAPLDQIPPLPGTQTEADAIKVDFPSAVVETGENAQESTAKQKAGGYRYLHFATHGLFNNVAPMMSSIVLAKPPPGSDEDGFLTAREIAELDWKAEMAVLSACDTARGEAVGGEGVVGLTWALSVAGVPTQIVSQWPVSDRSTSEWMKRFYHELKLGKPKGQATRTAALGLMRDGQHAHPFYWAPFILMGNWK